MGEKKFKRYMTPKQIREEGIVSWSDTTFKRRIEHEGLVAVHDTGGPLIDLDDLDKWMQQRKKFDGKAS